MRIGFVGTGVIGGGMAYRALAEQQEGMLYDRRPEAVADLFAKGCAVAGSAAELAAACDVIVTSLPTENDVRQAFFDADGVLQGLRDGALVIETSTVPPQVIRDLAPQIAARRAD